MTQRAAQKEETRRRLVEAAERLIAERGFLALRTADVAQAAGVSHGAVFVHFPTREALLAAVTSALGRRLTDRLYSMYPTTLRESLTAHLRCLAEEEPLYTRLLVERPLLPELTADWTMIQSAVAHHIALPSAFLFNTWIGLVHHYLMNRELFAPKGSVLKKHGKWLVDHFLELVEQ
jgi:AcrR family transcriptional regulator